MLPHRRCASMPALPLWVCIDVSPPTVLHCRCAAMLALPRCPTVAVKSVFKIHALLLRYMHLDLPHGASSWQRQYSSAPHHSPAAPGPPGLALPLGSAGRGWVAWPAGSGLECELRRMRGPPDGQQWQCAWRRIVAMAMGPIAASCTMAAYARAPGRHPRCQGAIQERNGGNRPAQPARGKEVNGNARRTCMLLYS